MENFYDKNKAHYVVVTGILVKYENSQNSQSLDLGGKSLRNLKFLITKRADWEKAFPGRWTVPGGKLEVLDYALKEKDTEQHWYNIFEFLLKREVKEEVNLDIENIGYVTSMVYIRPDGIPCIIVSLFAYPSSDKIKLCPALTEYAWVDLQVAKNYDLIEGIYNELEILDSFLRAGKHMIWKKQNN
jgi:8-oxo-dGTP pyrophosphatase MutT (NUDIX family)